jgi:hypothetical protein
MTEQTKHYLIVGGGLVVSVAVAIIVYKKFEVSSQASQAANAQANQDELAELEASAIDDPYGYADASAADTGISFPSAGNSQSIAQELQAIEQEFGFDTGTGSAGSPTSSGSPSSSSPPTSSPATPSTGPAPVAPKASPIGLSDEPAELDMEHEAFGEAIAA